MTLKDYQFNFIDGKKLFRAKIGAFAGFCPFFAPKKGTKKGMAVEKSNHFCSPEAAQKKLASASVRACGPFVLLGSNSFLLLPPPGCKNGDFSKAIPPAAWYTIQSLV